MYNAELKGRYVMAGESLWNLPDVPILTPRDKTRFPLCRSDATCRGSLEPQRVLGEERNRLTLDGQHGNARKFGMELGGRLHIGCKNLCVFRQIDLKCITCPVTS